MKQLYYHNSTVFKCIIVTLCLINSAAKWASFLPKCSCSTKWTFLPSPQVHCGLCFVLIVGVCVSPGEISLATLQAKQGTIIPPATVQSDWWEVVITCPTLIALSPNSSSLARRHTHTLLLWLCGIWTNNEAMYEECWVGLHPILLRGSNEAWGKMC